jgi:predicted dehydrogenase
MLRIGIIGAGGIAKAHVGALKDIPAAKIVAVADVRKERAEAMAAAHGAEATTEWRELLSRVDAVHICTPPTLHREQTLAALAAGKPVFLEKPIATTREDGEAIVRAVQEKGGKVMVGFNHRFRPPIQKFREIYASGSLGKLITYWTTRMSPDAPGGDNWRITPGLLCGIAIESISHDIDTLRWIAGEVATVYARTSCSVPDLTGYNDNVVALMTMKNGGDVTFLVSWTGHVASTSRGIIGTKGTVRVEGPGMWSVSAVRWRTAEAKAEEAMTVPGELQGDMAYLEENRHFVESVEANRPFSVTEADGMAALDVSLAIHCSAETGGVVALGS